MPGRVSEAIILRSYPLREADLIVSCFTRDQGKLRGVAKRARRPGNRFGSGLERLSLVRLEYFQRENRELVNLDGCELISSAFEVADYATAVALDYLAEVSEHLLPPGEPNERFFRLLAAVTNRLRQAGGEAVWLAAAYFSLWAVRLSGFLPELPGAPAEKLLSEQIMHKPIGEMSEREWNKQNTAVLRCFLVRRIEEHVERKLVTVPHLEAL